MKKIIYIVVGLAILFGIVFIIVKNNNKTTNNNNKQTGLINTIQTPNEAPNTNSNTPQKGVAISPYIDFEATVISLSLDQSNNYLEGGRIISAPDDSAVVRIDNILETGGAYNFNWSSLGIERGGETSLHFKYTTRPTRIITVVGETSQNGDTVSHQIVPTQITLENGQFVFRINGNSETETILPGLQVGSRFRTKLWDTSEVKIEKYGILN